MSLVHRRKNLRMVSLSCLRRVSHVVCLVVSVLAHRKIYQPPCESCPFFSLEFIGWAAITADQPTDKLAAVQFSSFLCSAHCLLFAFAFFADLSPKKLLRALPASMLSFIVMRFWQLNGLVSESSIPMKRRDADDHSDSSDHNVYVPFVFFFFSVLWYVLNRQRTFVTISSEASAPFASRSWVPCLWAAASCLYSVCRLFIYFLLMSKSIFIQPCTPWIC